MEISPRRLSRLAATVGRTPAGSGAGGGKSEVPRQNLHAFEELAVAIREAFML